MEEELPPNRKRIGFGFDIVGFVKRRFRVSVETAETNRGHWAGRADFILSCIGFAVGLGNVWRFPYLCYRNGGGVFFIPYCIALFGVGVPLLALEFAVGQFTSTGPYRAWEYVIAFKGIGLTMVMISVAVSFYYNTIIAWAIWYLFASMTYELPWSTCRSWASEFCTTNLTDINATACTEANGLIAFPNNGTCYNRTSTQIYGIYNKTLAATHGIKEQLPAADFLAYVGLKTAKSSGITDLGAPRWDMTFCILLSWILIFSILICGVQSSGRVAYFTATFPYVTLFILLIFGVTREGSFKGIHFYLTPDLSVLSKGEVWKDAGAQIFFSLSCTMGGMVVYSSYNPFNRDLIRNAIVVCVCNSLTSVLAGFVVFSFIGTFAHSIGEEVKDVVASGVELAFVVYAQACTILPGGPFWAVTFFFMLIILGLDSLFSMVETIVIGITELLPKYSEYRRFILLAVLSVFFLFGLSMATPGGIYIVTLFDDYSMTWNCFVLSLLELTAVAIYGPMRLTRDIEVMIGKTTMGCIPWSVLKWFFIVCWCGISPLILIFILFYSWSKLTFTAQPAWYYVLGWMISFIILMPTLVVMPYTVFKAEGTLSERLRQVLKPSVNWGPYAVKNRKLITYVEGFDFNPRGLPTTEEEDPVNTPNELVGQE